MDEDYLTSQAHELVELLQATFPQWQFQVYAPHMTLREPEVLYIFGFVSRETLLGGYELPAEAATMDFAGHVVGMVQFFRKAAQGNPPLFFPPEVQTLYDQHRASGSHWYRLI